MIDKSTVNSFNMLILLSMLYLSIMFANAILTNRYIGNDNYFILGGTLTSPLIFMLDNVVAEIYGYKITRNLILFGYIMLTFFVLICQLVLYMPHPNFFKYNEIYNKLLGSSLLRIDISGFTAYVIANLINAYILTRWKKLLMGKYFWLRSFGSSAFSAGIYSLIAIILMEINLVSFNYVIKIVLLSYFIKIIWIIILAYPCNILVYFLKKFTGLDIYGLSNLFVPKRVFDGK